MKKHFEFTWEMSQLGYLVRSHLELGGISVKWGWDFPFVKLARLTATNVLLGSFWFRSFWFRWNVLSIAIPGGWDEFLPIWNHVDIYPTLQVSWPWFIWTGPWTFQVLKWHWKTRPFEFFSILVIVAGLCIFSIEFKRWNLMSVAENDVYCIH